MTAKEYQKKYLDSNGDMAVLTEIGKSFLIESSELFKKRGGKSNAALFAVFDELDLKWKAFARCDKKIQMHGFSNLLNSMMPDVHRHWQQNKKRKNG